MRNSLFDDDPAPADPEEPGRALPALAGVGAEPPGWVQPARPDADLVALAAAIAARWGDRLHLGTSSWSFPGWAGQVWDRPYAQSVLARGGLAAYAAHPLMRAVSLDRALYRPLPRAEYAALARQVPGHFRFVVKAPALVTDAVLRGAHGAPVRANALFLDPKAAVESCARPALGGLGATLGALVFQISPLPREWLADVGRLHRALDAMFAAVAAEFAAAGNGADVADGLDRAAPPRIALEVRDPLLLTPALAEVLKRHGVRYALGLHDRMPAADAQRPMLRAMWPGDLVCRWNLAMGRRYAEAKEAWAPFDRMREPDLASRRTLATIARATLDAGHRVFITINNKAEGSAPASVRALAEAIVAG